MRSSGPWKRSMWHLLCTYIIRNRLNCVYASLLFIPCV